MAWRMAGYACLTRKAFIAALELADVAEKVCTRDLYSRDRVVFYLIPQKVAAAQWAAAALLDVRRVQLTARRPI